MVIERGLIEGFRAASRLPMFHRFADRVDTSVRRNPSLSAGIREAAYESGLRLDVHWANREKTTAIMQHKPLLIVANHQTTMEVAPVFSFLGQVIPQRDVRVLAFDFIYDAAGPAAKKSLLPVSLSNPEITRKSIDEAKQFLANGGAVVIFPGGIDQRSQQRWKTGVAHIAEGLLDSSQQDGYVIPLKVDTRRRDIRRYLSSSTPAKEFHNEVFVGEPISIRETIGKDDNNARRETHHLHRAYNTAVQAARRAPVTA